MKRIKSILHNQLFALLLGLIDGVLTVLTLATGHILQGKDSLTLSLSLKVAFATSLSGACIYFFSEYSHLRQRLIHAEQELNLMHHGRLATTQLGKQVLKETVTGVFVSSIFSFTGAMLPLGCAVLFPTAQWISIIIALIILFIMGIAIAKLVYGTPFKWVLALLAAGILMGYAGYKLNVV